jgi:zinc protease
MSAEHSIGVLDRSKPPMPSPNPQVAFPKFQEHRLSNGLRVFIVENHEQPIASVALYVKGGSILEPIEGLASISADLLTKGTTSRTATEIAEQIDFVGGSLHASSSWDSIAVSVGVLSKFLPIGMELLADIALHPTFPDEELDRVKLQRVAGLKQAKADASFLADSIFTKLVFPDHPYGKQASGTEETVVHITKADVEHFHKRTFGPASGFIVAAGDIEPKDFLVTLEGTFGVWENHVAPVMHFPAQRLQSGMKVALVEKEGAVQSAIRVGHLGIARSSEDYVSLHILNMLLGGYFNSRINLNLREKHGFTYGARSYFDTRIEPGPFVISTEVSTSVTMRSVEEILSEVRRICLDEISEEELDMVKKYVVGSFPLSIETPQQVASRVATIVLYDLEKDYYDSFRVLVQSLTQFDILAAAQRYLHPDQMTIAVSGNTSALSSAMSEFGEVMIFDAEGALLDTIAQL